MKSGVPHRGQREPARDVDAVMDVLDRSRAVSISRCCEPLQRCSHLLGHACVDERLKHSVRGRHLCKADIQEALPFANLSPEHLGEAHPEQRPRRRLVRHVKPRKVPVRERDRAVTAERAVRRAESSLERRHVEPRPRGCRSCPNHLALKVLLRPSVVRREPKVLGCAFDCIGAVRGRERHVHHPRESFEEASLAPARQAPKVFAHGERLWAPTEPCDEAVHSRGDVILLRRPRLLFHRRVLEDAQRRSV
mmetsp:Transcript_21496/g.69528  ORF Transcript_21496/g.69528 Transcript_21496/m.69528 type:complete len:250 (+) Transcript_21496:617-1366(+)